MQTANIGGQQDDNINYFGSVEDVQDNVSEKLARIFSFYHEQEFLDEIHGVIPAEIEVSIE